MKANNNNEAPEIMSTRDKNTISERRHFTHQAHKADGSNLVELD